GNMPSGYSPIFEEPWLQVPLARLDLAIGAVDTVAMADFAPRLDVDRDERWPAVNPFRAYGYSAAWAGGFITGRGMERTLTRRTLDGSVTQVVRWKSPDATVT